MTVFGAPRGRDYWRKFERDLTGSVYNILRNRTVFCEAKDVKNIGQALAFEIEMLYTISVKATLCGRAS